MTRSISTEMRLRGLWLALAALAVVVLSSAARADAPARRTFRVGTIQSEPWIMYDEATPVETRTPSGFSADLWNEIAKRLNGETKWVFYDTMPRLLNAVKTHEVDAGIAAITISLERERHLDFSNSMHESGLRILTRAQQMDTGATVKAVLKNLFWNLNSVLILAALFAVAHLVWFFNRRQGADFVPTGYREGIKEALRWSFVGLLGKGGSGPKKGVAWAIGLIWSFVSKMLFVVLTGVFSAALALSAIESPINTVTDLKGKRTAVVAGNAPELFMQGIGANLVPVKNFGDGVELLLHGKVEAFVHDAPRLAYWKYKVNQKEGKDVLRMTLEDFDRQNYGIVFPVDSRLRKEVNIELLNLREAPASGNKSFYDELVARWIPR
jgi:ABC-type amino acid transport substrate-binding protein